VKKQRNKAKSASNAVVGGFCFFALRRSQLPTFEWPKIHSKETDKEGKQRKELKNLLLARF